MYHPYLYGASIDPSARAGFFGIAGWHDTGDLMRALFEGVSFAHLAHLTRLQAAGVDPRTSPFRAAARGVPVWPQMLSDMLGRSLPVAAFNPRRARLAQRWRQPLAPAALPISMRQPPPWLRRQARSRLTRSATRIYQRRYKLWQAVEQSLAPHWATLRQFGDA